MRDIRGSTSGGEVVGWAIIFVFVSMLLFATGVVGVLILEGPEGLEDRTEQVTGNNALAEQVGDVFGDATMRDQPEGPAAPGATGEWPDHPQDDNFSALEVEQLIAEKINEIRADHNLSHLEPRPDVIAVARNHSRDMDERNYFAHETPEGYTPADRIDQAGVRCAVGENLGKMWYEPMVPDGYVAQGLTSEEEVATALVEGWMESPGHRENLLTPTYQTHGVGVHVGEDGDVYATHKFCT